MKNEITVRVHVTAADVKNGCACDSDNCPISIATTRAVKKIFGRSKLDSILKRTFYVETEGVPTVYLTEGEALPSNSPDEARINGFIGAFDEINDVRENLKDLKRRPKFNREDIAQTREELSQLEKDIAPFSFDLTLYFE